VGPKTRRLALRATLALSTVPLAAGYLLFCHVQFSREDLPDLEPLARFEPPTVGRLFDAHGELVLELAHEYRRVVPYPEIPATLRDAILAAEDKNFFSHPGVDFGVLPRVVLRTAGRSLSASVQASRAARAPRLALVFPQGGSTLTQQLVRAYFLGALTRNENANELTQPGFLTSGLSRLIGARATNKLQRKVLEMRLALWLEEDFRKRYGSKRAAKQEILARYASFIYLGHGRYGFAAASEYYFGKPLSSYALWDADKAALLAGIAKSPLEFAPSRANLERPLRRRNEVLRLMEKRAFLTPTLRDHCARAPIFLAAARPVKTTAPAVVSNVMAELARRSQGQLNLAQFALGRIRVHATVDNRVQEIVNEALERGLARYEKRHPASKGLVQGSVVVLANADARVLAEAGGRLVYRNRPASYTDFNRAVDSFRQPGSALKPVVYVAALAQGAQLDTEVEDGPILVPMGGGRPPKWIDNYDGEFKGFIPMRLALAESRNCATLWITERVGLPHVLETAQALGIRSKLQPYVTTALGASEVNLLELANLYRALASGLRAEPYIVERATDATGKRLLYAHYTLAEPLDFPPGTLEAIQEGLRSVVRLPSGTAHALNAARFPIPVMGKTGTTSDFRDALFVGSTYGARGITVAVRVGFDDNRELGEKETGGRAALPIFQEVVQRVYERALVGPVPRFPRTIEDGIDRYLQAVALAHAEAAAAEAAAMEASAAGQAVVADVPDPAATAPGLAATAAPAADPLPATVIVERPAGAGASIAWPRVEKAALEGPSGVPTPGPGSPNAPRREQP
jgi:penicillin-binding protein 1A